MDSNNVSVIARPGNTVVATIPVGSGPVGVAVTPDGTHAYVTNWLQHCFGDPTRPPTRWWGYRSRWGITPLASPSPRMGHTSTSRIVDSNNVSVIHTATNTVVKTIPVGTSPVGVAVTPDGTKVYVANIGSNTVSVIARPGNTVVATIPVGTGPVGVAIGP